MESESAQHGDLSAVSVLDSLTTAVLLLDGDLQLLYMNTACEMLLRVSRNPSLGQSLASLLPGCDELHGQVRRALREHNSFIERELQLARHSSGPVRVDCSVTPFDDAAQPAVLVELRSHENHLRDDSLLAQHQSSLQVVRGLAHEIKNPLGGLRGAAQLLQRELQRPELTEYTNVIIREADRLQTLVDQLLGPNQPPRMQSLNLHRPLEHVRQLIEASLPAGIVVKRDYDPSLPDAQADFDQLVQVFLNVLQNAVQALNGRDHGTITVRTRAERRHNIAGQIHSLAACIDIEDNGPGIPAELREQIFYPMVSHRDNGTGLGLAIAQTLIHAHHGQIECRSQPGHTVFSIHLPLKP